MIGLIGAGRMGLPVCARLVAAGHEVVVAELRPERERDVREAGASWAADSREAAAAADVLITMLPGTPELRAAMTTALPALRGGATWIDMTSATPLVDRDLGPRARERDIACLDAPVGGDPDAARRGELLLLVGGPPETLERYRTLLEVLGRIDHVGGPGAGHTAKLLVNLLWFGQALATGEALLLAERAGLDLEVLRETLGRSAAASEFIRRDLDALFAGDYLESFGLDRCRDELREVGELAAEHGLPFDLSSQVLAGYEQALERYGPVDGELLGVALLEERAAARLRPER